MKAHQSTVGQSNVWLTPRWILDALGPFDLDPAAAWPRPWDTAEHHFDSSMDGLAREWFGRVWLNPPFDRYERPKWMERMAHHGDGVMLLPAACETRPFRDHVFGRADGLLMLDRRPHFCDSEGKEAKANSGCTICLVAYGANNAIALQDSGLGVLLMEVTV